MGLGLQIKEARKRAGFTQKELAEKSNVATVSIQQYERGVRQPRIEQLQAIAGALGVSLSQLVDVPSASEDGKPIDSIGVRVDEANKVINSPTSTQAEIESCKEFLDQLEDVSPIPDMVMDSEIERQCRSRIDKALSKLSLQGQIVAAERVEELAKIPDYQRPE